MLCRGRSSPPSQPIANTAPARSAHLPFSAPQPFPGGGRTDRWTNECLGAGLGVAAYLRGCGRSRSQRAAPPCPRSRRTSGREGQERAALGTGADGAMGQAGAAAPASSAGPHCTHHPEGLSPDVNAQPGLYQMMQFNFHPPPLLDSRNGKRNLNLKIRVMPTGLNSSLDFQQDNIHVQQQLLRVCGLARKSR